MRNCTALVGTLAVLCMYPKQAKAGNRPDEAYVKVKMNENTGRGYVHIYFKWTTQEPGFEANEVFEVSLQIDPKNFAMPKGGNDKDKDKGYLFYYKKNGKLYRVAGSYRDVLNYSNADSVEEARILIQNDCSDIVLDGWWDDLVLGELTHVADKVANFAVGTLHPELLQKNVEYHIRYNLEATEEWLYWMGGDDHARAGFAWITTETFYDECMGNKDCPYLLGTAGGPIIARALRCAPLDGGDAWLNRLCVVTERHDFVPGDNTENVCWDNNVGGLRTSCRVCEELSLNCEKAQCVDKDKDEYFAVQKDAENIPIIMYGSHVGDCDDSPPPDEYATRIHNEAYYAESGICGPIDPCTTATSGTGYYCGENTELYYGNPGELYYCSGGISTEPPSGYPPAGPCPGDACHVSDPGIDDYCDSGCQPVTCTSQGFECGNQDDGCGGIHNCGVCPAGETCIAGTCSSTCGNGVCDAGETCSSCPQDCGNCCGNGVCDVGEDCGSCPQDCSCGCSPVYSQDFGNSGLFVDGLAGTQNWTDGGRFYTSSTLNEIHFASGLASPNSSLAIYYKDIVTTSDLRVEFPLPTAGSSTCIDFLAYNPQGGQSVNIYVSPSSSTTGANIVSIPPASITQVSECIISQNNMVYVILGDIVSTPSQYSFKIDTVTICQQ